MDPGFSRHFRADYLVLPSFYGLKFEHDLHRLEMRWKKKRSRPSLNFVSFRFCFFCVCGNLHRWPSFFCFFVGFLTNRPFRPASRRPLIVAASLLFSFFFFFFFFFPSQPPSAFWPRPAAKKNQ